MNRSLKSLLFFQRKIFVPGIVISAALGLSALSAPEKSVIGTTLLAYVFISPLLQFLLYDIGNPKEYYFFNNFGFSKLSLWCYTLGISLLSLIISALV